MCGIAGYLDIEQRAGLDRPEIIANLLHGIEVRGRHATGYAYHEGGTTNICKADLAATDFVETAPMFTDGLDSTPRVMLLHTRYATQGSPKNNQNNHPIYSKTTGLTLIHNGWLTNERQIIREFDLRKDAEVDSETVLRLIEYFKVVENKRIGTAIKLAMRKLEGKFACALMSEKYPDRLWLWTSGHPLAGYRDDSTGMFYFASTVSILENALIESGITPDRIGAMKDGRLLMLRATKGKFKGTFSDLKKTAKAKKQKPLEFQHQLIGMPRPAPTESQPMTRRRAKEVAALLTPELREKFWERWKEQNKVTVTGDYWERWNNRARKLTTC